MKVIEHPKPLNPIVLFRDYIAFCKEHPINHIDSDWREQSDERWQAWLDRNKEYILEIDFQALNDLTGHFYAMSQAFDGFRESVCRAFMIPSEYFK